MRRSSGELDVNMPPPLDSDTPLSSARALDMATAGAFTTAGVLTGSGARAPRNAAALASTHAVATDLMMHQALGDHSLRLLSHLDAQCDQAIETSNFEQGVVTRVTWKGTLPFHPSISHSPPSTLSPTPIGAVVAGAC